MIHISQAASREIKRLKQISQQPDNLVRLSIKNGGCSGLFYNLELDKVSPQTDTQKKAEGDQPSWQAMSDQVVSHQGQDHFWQSNGLTVIVDEQTYPLVYGLKLDYSEDLMGGGFRFQNPNATDLCKCGLSFKITKIPEQTT